MSTKLAIDGGTPVRTTPWPTWPIHDQLEEQALLRVLHSGQWWSVGGTEVPAFQEEFCAYQGANHTIAVTNGTAAIEVALRAAGIGCGDEVIVPPYTFIATASSVLAVSATPIFVDIRQCDLNMDPDAIEAAITPRTRAIIPVHIAGGPADMDAIMAIARKHNLVVIEDAAQAVGAEWNGVKVGAIGDMGTFSFQASKNLNCGEGGAVVTNSDDYGDRVWSIHNVGRTRSGKWYEHHVLGGNFRMTEWQGAILRAQLTRLPEQTAHRTRQANLLTGLLGAIPGITPPMVDPRITAHAYHLYALQYSSDAFGGHSRDQFIAALNAEGIPVGAGYVPLYKEVVFQRKARGEGSWCRGAAPVDYAGIRLPACERACEQAIWIFQTLLMGEPIDMHDIAEAITRIQAAWTA